MRIDPGRAADLEVSYDPGDDPDFHGGLSVAVTGYGPGEAPLFRAEVNLIVRPGRRGDRAIVRERGAKEEPR